MQRREFLKASLLATAAAMIPGLTPPMPEVQGGTRAEPFLALSGGPFRKSCDGLAEYDAVRFAAVTQDILHHRLPAKWREALVLGLPAPQGCR